MIERRKLMTLAAGAASAAMAQTPSGTGTAKLFFKQALPDLQMAGWAANAIKVTYAPGESSHVPILINTRDSSWVTCWRAKFAFSFAGNRRGSFVPGKCSMSRPAACIRFPETRAKPAPPVCSRSSLPRRILRSQNRLSRMQYRIKQHGKLPMILPAVTGVGGEHHHAPLAHRHIQNRRLVLDLRAPL